MVDDMYKNSYGAAVTALYFTAEVACIASFIAERRRKHKTDYHNAQYLPRSKVSIFYISLCAFLLVRIIGCSVRLLFFNLAEEKDYFDDLTFVFERTGSALFFTSYTVVLFFWAEMTHKSYVSATGFLPRLKWVFISLNALVYACVLGITVLCVLLQDSNISDSIYYSINLYFESFISISISIAYTVYGLRLVSAEKKKLPHERVTSNSSAWKWFLFCTVTFTACFALRSVMFFFWSLYDQEMRFVIFVSLAFVIPELVSSVLQLLLANISMKAEEQLVSYVNWLYTVSEIGSSKDYEHFPINKKRTINN
ncbi:hypothetical protein Pelo_9805 [Pelomyxa schiedti]|nr:hypothetical protein Pelo_9805 [Pelomyxa schiedti]